MSAIADLVQACRHGQHLAVSEDPDHARATSLSAAIRGWFDDVVWFVEHALDPKILGRFDVHGDDDLNDYTLI